MREEDQTAHPEPAGDFDYNSHGHGYAAERRPDPRIAALVHDAFGDARTVIVGAGAGSYEPLDRYVLPVEPSAVMRAQRPRHLAPALDAVAEQLPFDDNSFDAALASVTAHQWPDAAMGLSQLRRVTRGLVVVLTFDGEAQGLFWLPGTGTCVRNRSSSARCGWSSDAPEACTASARIARETTTTRGLNGYEKPLYTCPSRRVIHHRRSYRGNAEAARASVPGPRRERYSPLSPNGVPAGFITGFWGLTATLDAAAPSVTFRE